MARHVKRNSHDCGRHRVRRLMRLMRLVPIYQEPNTSKKHPQHIRKGVEEAVLDTFAPKEIKYYYVAVRKAFGELGDGLPLVTGAARLNEKRR